MDEFAAGVAPVVDSAGFREIMAIIVQAIAISLAVFLVVASVIGVVSLILSERGGKKDGNKSPQVRGKEARDGK